MSVKSTLSATALALLATAALTACQSGGTTATTGAGAPAGGQSSATAAASGASTGSGSAGTTAGSGAAPAAATSTRAAGSASGGGHATSDSYAYTHPCAKSQLSILVVRRSAAPSQRLIEVRNNGANSCGLSYYPLVSLDSAQGGTDIVKPLVPGGLGGAPAYPVYAGRTAYAVIDLDPSGATTGTVGGITELNVLADGDHMPNADTVNFALGSAAKVLKPKLGLYRSTVADAVSSMATANVQS